MSRVALQFGDFVLDLDSGELSQDGRSVEMAALPRKLLRYLGMNRHRTVPKLELLEEVWGGATVEESALHQAVKQLRHAVGDDGRQQTVVKTVVGVGYRFIADAIERRRSASSTLGTYVGRTALRGELERRAAAAAEGRGAVVLLAGEPGMGKSRTSDELAGYAVERGMLDLHGGGNPRSGAPPFWPWIEAFRELAASRPVDALRREAPSMLDTIPGPGAMELGEAERFRQFDIVKRCLHNAAELGPIVVVLEDLHEASAATLELLAFVARGAERQPVLFVATYREPELRREPARARALSSLVSLRSVTAHEIGELNEIETAYLIEQHAGQKLPPALVRALARRSLGNPFFAVELARLLGGSVDAPEIAGDAPGALDRSEEEWEQRIPRGAVRLLGNRIAALSPATQATMRVAAAIGPTFSAELLGRSAGTPGVLAALDEAVKARLVVEAGTASGSYRFSHALVRDALYDELAEHPHERRDAHLRIAEALAEAGERHDAEAAFHFCEAAPLREVERAVSVVRRAADRASAVGDADSAASLYRRAYSLLGAQAHGPLGCRLLVEAGEMGVRGSQLDEARGVLADALVLARELGEGRLFCRAALADAHRSETSSDTDPAVIGLLEEGLGRLGDEAGSLRAEVLARLAREVCYQPGGLTRAMELTERAIDDARQSGDTRALAHVLEEVTYVRWSGADPAAWLALNQEIVSAATQAGDPDLRFRGVKGLATAYLETGDRAAAEREIARCGQAAEEYPAPYLRIVTEQMRAAQAFLAGDFEAGERSAIETGASPLAAAKPAASAQLFYHRLETGRAAELEAAGRALIAESPAVRAWRFGLARVLVDLGRSDEAHEVIRSAGDLAAIPRDRNWLIGLALLAECLVFIRDDALAMDVFDRMRPLAGLNIVLGNGSLFYGNTSHFLGLLAASGGRDAEAGDFFDAAMAMHERMKAAPWIVRTQLEQAGLCARSGDTRRARTLAAGAEESARQLGMPRHIERAVSLAAGAP